MVKLIWRRGSDAFAYLWERRSSATTIKLNPFNVRVLTMPVVRYRQRRRFGLEPIILNKAGPRPSPGSRSTAKFNADKARHRQQSQAKIDIQEASRREDLKKGEGVV